MPPVRLARSRAAIDLQPQQAHIATCPLPPFLRFSIIAALRHNACGKTHKAGRIAGSWSWPGLDRDHDGPDALLPRAHGGPPRSRPGACLAQGGEALADVGGDRLGAGLGAELEPEP